MTILTRFAVLATIFLFSACSNVKSFESNDNDWLPSDFDPTSTVLVIQKVEWPKRQQAIIEEFMKEKYPFKYDFRKSANIDEEYPDTATHRFVLLYSANTHTPAPGSKTVLGYDNRLTITMFDFHFYDRSKKKAYAASGIGASWASFKGNDKSYPG